MAAVFHVRPAEAGDRGRALAIGEGLPAWFNEQGLAAMAADLPFQRVLVACEGERVIGFVSFFATEGVAHIGWMGVEEPRHRRGAGRALVDAMCAELEAAGVAAVHVDTLGDGVDYEPYERTRAFYRALGFTEHARVKQDDPGYPERLTLRRELPPSVR